jgi:hypothetical protein
LPFCLFNDMFSINWIIPDVNNSSLCNGWFEFCEFYPFWNLLNEQWILSRLIFVSFLLFQQWLWKQEQDIVIISPKKLMAVLSVNEPSNGCAKYLECKLLFPSIASLIFFRIICQLLKIVVFCFLSIIKFKCSVMIICRVILIFPFLR